MITDHVYRPRLDLPGRVDPTEALVCAYMGNCRRPAHEHAPAPEPVAAPGHRFRRYASSSGSASAVERGCAWHGKCHLPREAHESS